MSAKLIANGSDDRTLGVCFITLVVLTHIFVIIFPYTLWDDVPLYYGSSQTFDVWFGDAGLSYMIPLYKFILSLDSPEVRIFAPIILGLTFFLSYWILWKTLKLLPFLTKQDAFWIAILTACIPMNFSKPLLTPFSYNSSTLLFLIGGYFYVHFELRKGITSRISALIFLGCSFLTLSFAALIGVILIIGMAIQSHERQLRLPKFISSPRNFLNFSLMRLDYILLPFFVLIIRNSYLQPTGLYENYNKTSLHNLLVIPQNLFIWVYKISAQFVRYSSRLVLDFPIFSIIVALFFVSVIILLRMKPIKDQHQFNSRFGYFCIATLFVFLAVFGYLSLGKFPDFADWNSRHQVTLQIVSGFFFWSSICLFDSTQLRRKLLISMLSVFSALTFLYNFSAHRDAQIQEGYMVALANSPQYQKYNTIFVNDIRQHERTTSRGLRFYEWSLANWEIKNNTRFFLSVDKDYDKDKFDSILLRYCEFKLSDYEHYGMSGWNPRGPGVILDISTIESYSNFTSGNIIRSLWLRFFDPIRYTKDILSKISITEKDYFESDVVCPN